MRDKDRETFPSPGSIMAVQAILPTLLGIVAPLAGICWLLTRGV